MWIWEALRIGICVWYDTVTMRVNVRSLKDYYVCSNCKNCVLKLKAFGLAKLKYDRQRQLEAKNTHVQSTVGFRRHSVWYACNCQQLYAHANHWGKIRLILMRLLYFCESYIRSISDRYTGERECSWHFAFCISMSDVCNIKVTHVWWDGLQK